MTPKILHFGPKYCSTGLFVSIKKRSCDPYLENLDIYIVRKGKVCGVFVVVLLGKKICVKQDAFIISNAMPPAGYKGQGLKLVSLMTSEVLVPRKVRTKKK